MSKRKHDGPSDEESLNGTDHYGASDGGYCSSSDDSSDEDVPTLSPEQEAVRELVLSGKSIFLTGRGGTGKSLLTKTLIRDLATKYGGGAVAVTGTTGIAALQIGGISVHSFAGIGLGTDPTPKLAEKVKKNHFVASRWRATKCLVIDEISMLDCELFDKLNQIASVVRDNAAPFGGLQLLLVGDFAQLPPVVKGSKQGPRFCFESRMWGQAVQRHVELTHIFRQSNQEFRDMLNEIRLGRCTPQMAAKLSATSTTEFPPSVVEPTSLYCKNMDVNLCNIILLQELPGTLLSFEAEDKGDVEVLDKNCLAKRCLQLKPMAQVILLKNLDFEAGLVNGTKGVFVEATDGGVLTVDFETSSGVLRYHLGKEEFKVQVKGWKKGKKRGKNNEVSQAQVGHGEECESQVGRREECESQVGRREECESQVGRREECEDHKVACRTQYPIALAYALMIHKCQGMTLSKVEMSLKDCFEYGQAYVALSQVSDLKGLRLLDFHPSVIKCHPKVLEFYKNMTGVS